MTIPFDPEKSRYCLHHNHRWQSLNEKMDIQTCSHCHLRRDARQEDIYRIPHLVRYEVGYKNRKQYF